MIGTRGERPVARTGCGDGVEGRGWVVRQRGRRRPSATSLTATSRRAGLGRRPERSPGSTGSIVSCRGAEPAHASKARGVGDVLSPGSGLREVAISGDHAERGVVGRVSEVASGNACPSRSAVDRPGRGTGRGPSRSRSLSRLSSESALAWGSKIGVMPKDPNLARGVRTSLVAVHRTALGTRCSPKRPDLPRSRPTLQTEGPDRNRDLSTNDGRTRPDSRSLPGLDLDWPSDPAGQLGIEGFPGPSIPRIRTGRGRFTWSGNHSLTLLRTAVRVTSSNAAGCILPTTCCGGNPKTTTFGPSFEEPGFFGTLEGYRPPGICPARHLVVDERSPTDAPQHVVDTRSTAVDCPVRAFRNPNEVRTLDA